jgi:YbgC/YbaW family acyl-CoA thioester hydrolase
MNNRHQRRPISEYRTRRRVEFADTDMGGIVHFSRFLVFMETAEHELLTALGSQPMATVDGRLYGWPRVSAECEYLSPARMGDELEIVVKVTRKGRASITYEFLFTCADRAIARGRMTTVHCRMDAPGGPSSEPIPETVAARLQPFEETG